MKAKKKILVDGISLLSPFTGVAKYTYENATRLRNNYAEEYEWFYDYGFHSQDLIQTQNNKGSIGFLKKIKATVVSLPFLKLLVREGLSILSYLSSPQYDLYWQPNFIPKRVKAKKTIATIHDFSFYIQPSWHPKERLKYYEKNFWKASATSDWLITGSNFTKDEILKYMEYPKEKITVIHHGVDHNLYKVYDIVKTETTKNKLKLSDDFLLFVGSIEPRKNLLNLLKAYHCLPQSIKNQYPLVLAGFKGWENAEVMNEIEKEKEHIKYLGYLSDEELAHVYNLATVFVYPSLYEGFGIPPLEAMASGTAVIASDVASLPEACGEAVLYVNPEKYEDIAEKIMYLLENKEERKGLIAKGFIHSAKFTWEKAAKAHMEVFEKVLNDRH